MKKRLKGLLCALTALALVICLPVKAHAAALPSGIGSGEIGAEIEKFAAAHESTTAGMQVSVFSGDETVYTGYFGCADKENAIAVDESTVMEWGSASKLLVWVSAMQLWEQGKLDLDADISEYLPEELCANRSFDTPVTMINLMNHNAGYQEVYADIFLKDADAVLPLEEALKAHAPAQIYEPGTVTAYSNWSTALAALIVERVSGKDYVRYVHENIFEPLGMNNTALAADLSDNSAVAQKRRELQCYTSDGDLIPDCFYYIPIYPAGMCTSTIGDFEKLGKALLDENSPLFQSPETWQTLFTPTNYLGDSSVPSNCHGFWAIPYGVLTVGHGGNTAGCSSYLLLDLESKTGAVVMTNQAGEGVYNTKMMRLIFGEYSEEKYFGADRETPSGIYTPARSFRKGPFKIMGLSFGDASYLAELGGVWAAGADKVSMPYGDYFRVPTSRLVWELALVILWVAALIFSFVRVLIIDIRKLVYKIRKNETKIAQKIPMNGWSLAASLLQFAGVCLIVVVAAGTATYAPASSFTWASAAFIPLILAMAALFVLGIIKMSKASLKKRQTACAVITLIALAIAVANFVYWEFFMFPMI